MMIYEDVKSYIDESIFHSDSFDVLDDDKKRKAVNNAESILYHMYKSYKPEKNPLPIEAIAYQTMWILAKDETFTKADMGLASQSIEGMTQTFANRDKTVSPEVKRILKKRVGTYNITITDTNRGVILRDFI